MTHLVQNSILLSVVYEHFEMLLHKLLTIWLIIPLFDKSATETGPVYCKSGFNGFENSGQDYEICRTTNDPEDSIDCFEPQTGCTCERLAVKDYTKEPFELRGGSDCNDGYCFVSK